MFALGVSVYVLCVLDDHSDREADGDDDDILEYCPPDVHVL
jgi:hypothetical protein